MWQFSLLAVISGCIVAIFMFWLNNRNK
ncbi:type I toxin-antitoxin system Fst family toxin [Staphylococcus sp. FSL H8-0121]